MFGNFSFKKTPYDIKKMAKILEASYTAEMDRDEDVRKENFSPSQIGYGDGACPRRWVLMFQGARVQSNLSSTSVDNMENGTDRHERIQRNFKNSSLDLEIEKELWHKDPSIHCFVDVYIKEFEGLNIPVEIKTTRSEAWVSRRANNKGPAYQELQLLIYMYLLKDDHGLLLYENKNDHSKIIIPVEMTAANKERIEKVFDWMREVEKAYQDKLLPENPYRSNSKVCRSCPIKKDCFSRPKGDIKIPALDYSEDVHVADW